MTTEENPIAVAGKIPSYEEKEGIKTSLRSCESCIHVKTCKIFDLQVAHTKTLEAIAEQSGITLDIPEAHEVGNHCSEFKSPVQEFGV